MKLTDEMIAGIKSAALAATPQDLDSAQVAKQFDDGAHWPCPVCGGEGSVEREAEYVNYDGAAIGVQFYGVGNEHGSAEAYVRAANPRAVLALIARLEAAEAALGANRTIPATDAVDPICAPDLAASEGGRTYLVEFFLKRLRRHEFRTYIEEELAEDFACALASYLHEHDSTRAAASLPESLLAGAEPAHTVLPSGVAVFAQRYDGVLTLALRVCIEKAIVALDEGVAPGSEHANDLRGVLRGLDSFRTSQADGRNVANGSGLSGWPDAALEQRIDKAVGDARRALAVELGQEAGEVDTDTTASLRWRYAFGKALLGAAPHSELTTSGCWCETCRPITLCDMRMVLCPDCGNKRCPRATDHRNACTGSNEPGQPGSSWENVRPHD